MGPPDRRRLGRHAGRRRSDVDDLNGRARAYLKHRGDVSGPELVVNQRPFQAGDDIICLRNNRRLGVCNGTRGTITRVDLDRWAVEIRVGDETVRLPAEYLAAGHIAHGYATTIHKAQAATILEVHHLGLDIDLSAAARPAALGTPTETAELRARLHVLARTSHDERSVDRNVGLDL